MRRLHVFACFAALAALVAAPAPGADELHRGLGPAPDSIEPHRAQGLSAFNLLRDLHEGLLTRDAHGRPVAGLAESWSVSPDRRSWTFTLRPEARWSDGTPILAEDFVRGWRNVLNPASASPTAAWLEAVAEVEAPSPNLFVVRLQRPVPWFQELLTLPPTLPLPPPGKPNYSGAFRLVRSIPGSRFELERNPYHYDTGRIALARVVWHVTEDAGAELARFRAGELQTTEAVPPGRLEWLQRELGPALRISPYLGSFYLVYNLDRAPLGRRPALRRALSLAIDRDILVERVLGSGELPAERLVPPGLDGWPQPLRDPRPFAARVAEARALLNDAGYGPDQPLEVELRFNSSLTHRRMGAAVAAMWKQHLGVVTRQVTEEWKVFVTNRRQGRITEIVRGGWIADWADPGNFLGLFHSQSPLNYAFYRDLNFDALLDRAADRDGAARRQLLIAAEQHLLERHVIIPLYFYVSRHLVNPGVLGWEDNVMDIHPSRWLRLEPGQ